MAPVGQESILNAASALAPQYLERSPVFETTFSVNRLSKVLPTFRSWLPATYMLAVPAAARVLREATLWLAPWTNFTAKSQVFVIRFSSMRMCSPIASIPSATVSMKLPLIVTWWASGTTVIPSVWYPT